MTRRRALLIAAIIALAAVGAPWLKRQLDVDRCLDAGGCWDRIARACEYEDDAKCRR